ncbi:hypothetical protein KY289_009650 [Solanum tuberosum]|nr:hypothetical protein KY289_009650 [Solanum tuberosum]
MMRCRLLKGRSFPVKVLITRRSDPLDNSTMRSPDNHGSLRDSEMGPSQQADGSFEGYAPPSSDRREGVLRRKRLDYLDCVAQYYDIPDIERTDEEINMLRQIAVDCPRTVPDVSFFQQAQVQKSLEHILYLW